MMRIRALRTPLLLLFFCFLLALHACSPVDTERQGESSTGDNDLGELATPSPTGTETSTPSPTASPTASPTHTPTATATQTPFICPGSLATRLKIGISAYVSFYPPYANRVRGEPNWNTGAILGFIQPGEVVDVLDGPVCANGVVWWRVQSREQNLTGWTVEGDLYNYWIIPQKVLATPAITD